MKSWEVISSCTRIKIHSPVYRQQPVDIARPFPKVCYGRYHPPKTLLAFKIHQFYKHPNKRFPNHVKNLYVTAYFGVSKQRPGEKMSINKQENNKSIWFFAALIGLSLILILGSSAAAKVQETQVDSHPASAAQTNAAIALPRTGQTISYAPGDDGDIPSVGALTEGSRRGS